MASLDTPTSNQIQLHNGASGGMFGGLNTQPMFSTVGDMQPRNGNAFAPFFGDSAKPIEINPYDSFRSGILPLPDAYRGNNPFMKQIVINMVKKDKQGWATSIAMPVRVDEQNQSYVWDQIVFHNATLDQVPELGVSRTVTSSTSERRESLRRYGLGFELEHGFMQTAVGRQQYTYNLMQLRNAVLDTAFISVLDAYKNCKTLAKKWQSRNGRPLSALQKKRILENEVNNFAAIQKNEHGFDLIDANIKMSMKDINGKKPNMWILPPKAKHYLTNMRKENYVYYLRGPGGDAVYKSGTNDGEGRMVDTLNDCMIFESENFELNGLAEPYDPLIRPRSVGSWMFMGMHLHGFKNWVDYSSAMRGVVIFDEGKGDMVLITLEQAIENCSRFDKATGLLVHNRRAHLHLQPASGSSGGWGSNAEDPAETDMFLMGDRSKPVACELFGDMSRDNLRAATIEAWAHSVVDRDSYDCDDLTHMIALARELCVVDNTPSAETKAFLNLVNNMSSDQYNARCNDDGVLMPPTPCASDLDKFEKAITAGTDITKSPFIDKFKYKNLFGGAAAKNETYYVLDTAATPVEVISLKTDTDLQDIAGKMYKPVGYGTYFGMKELAHERNRWMGRYHEIAKNGMAIFEKLARRMQTVCPESIFLNPDHGNIEIWKKPCHQETLWSNLMVQQLAPLWKQTPNNTTPTLLDDITTSFTASATLTRADAFEHNIFGDAFKTAGGGSVNDILTAVFKEHGLAEFKNLIDVNPFLDYEFSGNARYIQFFTALVSPGILFENAENTQKTQEKLAELLISKSKVYPSAGIRALMIMVPPNGVKDENFTRKIVTYGDALADLQTLLRRTFGSLGVENGDTAIINMLRYVAAALVMIKVHASNTVEAPLVALISFLSGVRQNMDTMPDDLRRAQFFRNACEVMFEYYVSKPTNIEELKKRADKGEEAYSEIKQKTIDLTTKPGAAVPDYGLAKTTPSISTPSGRIRTTLMVTVKLMGHKITAVLNDTDTIVTSYVDPDVYHSNTKEATSAMGYSHFSPPAVPGTKPTNPWDTMFIGASPDSLSPEFLFLSRQRALYNTEVYRRKDTMPSADVPTFAHTHGFVMDAAQQALLPQAEGSKHRTGFGAYLDEPISANFREQFASVQMHPDPCMRLAMSVLLGSPITKQQLDRWVRTDCLVPFNFILARPFETYNMACGILAIAGASTGETIIGHANIELTDDAIVKKHTGNFTCYLKAIVWDESNVALVPDIMSKGYIGGADSRFIATKNDHEQIMHEGIQAAAGKSIYAIMVPYHFTANELPCPFDLRGRFHDQYQEVYSAANSRLHYPTAHFYRAFWDWGSFNNAPFDMGSEFEAASQVYNTVLFRGHHQVYNVQNQSYTEIIPGNGHWGDRCYPGCQKVRNGEDKILMPMSAISYYGGVGPAQPVVLGT